MGVYNGAGGLHDITENLVSDNTQVLGLTWERGGMDGSGPFDGNGNLRTVDFIEVLPGERLIIQNTSKIIRIAVYGIYDGVYKILTNGYLNGYSITAFNDWRPKYRIRLTYTDGREMVPTDGNVIYVTKKNASIIDSIDPRTKTLTNVSYTRNYTYLNNLINGERKTISQNGTFSDSTTNCVLTLPKHGSVEVRQQRYTGMFKVVRINGSTVEWLVSSWSYYSYRYNGDGESDYYALVALSPNGTDEITVDSAKDKVAVYSYLDEGVRISEKLSGLYGKKIAFIGDSITQGRFIKSGSTLNWTATKRFGDLIAEQCNDMNYGNFGIGGALTSGNEWKSLLSNCGKVSDYDVVFICGGTNDYGNNVNESTFKSAYRTIVDTLKANNTEVVACTPVYRTSRTDPNSAGLYLYDFVDFIKAVATEKSIKCLDLYSLTNDGIFITTCPDGLHPNELGHKIMADHILAQYDEVSN